MSRVYQPSPHREIAAVQLVALLGRGDIERARAKLSAHERSLEQKEFWRKAEQARRRGHKLTGSLDRSPLGFFYVRG